MAKENAPPPPEDDILDDEDDSKGNKKKKDEDDGLDESDIKSARSLYKALKDPETSSEVIETLARRAGLLDKKGGNTETKKEVKDELGRITKKFKSGLGKDFEGFSDKVGPLLDEAIKEYMEEHFGKASAKSSEAKWEGEIEKFQESHELTRKVEKKMQELMEDAPPNIKKDGFKAQTYLNRMYKSALEELGEEAPAPKKKSKDNDDDNESGIIERKRPAGLTTEQAVEAAMRGIRYKS